MSALTLPSISVVIPAYKARNYLRESLASVAAQDYPALEVLVIDDASPEPIDDILQKYSQNESAPRIRLIRHDRNQGLGASRNTGIRAATGGYVALLDHDDLWAPNHLRNLVEISQSAAADLAYCSVIQFQDRPENDSGMWGPHPEDLTGNFHFALFARSFITPSSTLIRRELLMELGGFNTSPNVHMCEDLDLWLRMMNRGCSLVCAEQATCYYRKHPDAATSRPGYMAFQSAYVRQLHAKTVPAPWNVKRSLVAASWWTAWITFLKTDDLRWDVLARAIWHGLPVPWEIARGLVRTLRCLNRKHAPSMPAESRP
jgi:GT2 family glycosyltransferase